MHGTSRLFPVFISPVVWNMCEHLHYESVYFKDYTGSKNTIYRAGAAVVSTIFSYNNNNTPSLIGHFTRACSVSTKTAEPYTSCNINF